MAQHRDRHAERERRPGRRAAAAPPARCPPLLGCAGRPGSRPRRQASNAAADAIHSSWRRSSSLARRSRSTRETAEAIRPAATSSQPTVSSGAVSARLPSRWPSTKSPGRRRQRPERVQDEPGQRDPDGPAPARRRQVPVGCDEEDHDQGGEGRPAEQRSRPGGHVGPGRGTGAAPVEHPDAVGLGGQGHREQAGRAQQPAEGVRGWRETMSAPMRAQPRLASGASGQPWSAHVASLSKRAVRGGEDGVQDGGEHGQAEHRPGDRARTSATVRAALASPAAARRPAATAVTVVPVPAHATSTVTVPPTASSRSRMFDQAGAGAVRRCRRVEAGAVVGDGEPPPSPVVAEPHGHAAAPECLAAFWTASMQQKYRAASTACRESSRSWSAVTVTGIALRRDRRLAAPAPDPCSASSRG